MNGTRISRNTSTDTRKPANRNTTPRNLPSWNSSVDPARLSESVIVGKNAPRAIRIVAGHARVEAAGDQLPERVRAATRRG